MRTGRIYPDAIVRPLRRPWLVLAIAVAVVALPTVASGALSAPSGARGQHDDLPGLDRRGAGCAGHHDDRRVERRRRRRSRSRSTSRTRPQYSQDLGGPHGHRQRREPGDRRPENFGADFVLQLIRGEIDPLQVGRLRLPAQRDAVVAVVLVVERADDSDQRVGSQQHAKARVRRAGGVRDRIRRDDRRDRLHELQARLRTARSGSTRTRSRSRSRRWS